MSEYRYLGVILSRNVKKGTVFEAAFKKLRTRVSLFLTVSWSFSSRIQIANIYLYPLISYLLNFFSLSCALEVSLMGNISRFVFPMRNIDHVFVRLAPQFTATLNLCPVTHSDHVALFLHISSSRKTSKRLIVASAFADPAFAEFVSLEHEKHPLSSNYRLLLPNLQRLAVEYTRQKVAPDSSPLFLFDLLHALQTRDRQKWNDLCLHHGYDDMQAKSANELTKRGRDLSNLFFQHNSPFFVGSRIRRKWCLEYLRASIPSGHHSLLRHFLDEDGNIVDDPSEAGKLLHTTWSKQFKESQTTHELRPFLDKLSLPSFADFSVNLSSEEIDKTIKSLSNDSAPGPDGITNTLIRGVANVFIPVIWRIYRQMSSGSLPSEDYLSGFINFIEKKDCAPTPSNLRPITIPNSIHRLVGKLVSDQMQPFLSTHIHPSQSAFINDRWITNNVRRVNDVITKRKSGWLLFVDFSKAYDSINREALIEIMKAYGFQASKRGLVREDCASALSDSLKNLRSLHDR